MNKNNSIYGLRKYQLLNVIEQYNELNPADKITKYKTKKYQILKK